VEAFFLWGHGPAGKDRGESGARQRPEARDIAKMKREEKRMERVDGKAAGDYGFITCQRIGLADGDGARADAIPNAAGGESGHGAAKPDGVIHRYGANPIRSYVLNPAALQCPHIHRKLLDIGSRGGVVEILLFGPKLTIACGTNRNSCVRCPRKARIKPVSRFLSFRSKQREAKRRLLTSQAL
jgi:hypothetical protein